MWVVTRKEGRKPLSKNDFFWREGGKISKNYLKLNCGVLIQSILT